MTDVRTGCSREHVRVERDRAAGPAGPGRPTPSITAASRRTDLGRRLAVLGAAILSGLLAYLGARALGGSSSPWRNAATLETVEGALGIGVERDLQRRLLADAPIVVTASDVFYALTYWPVVVGSALRTWLCRRDAFVWLRDIVVLTGLVGIVLHAAFPVAPPRLLPGYVDTVDTHDALRHLARPPFILNEHAAFPSFHVAWFAAALAALVRGRAGLRWRAAVVGLVVVMAVAVVVTANHFIVDVVAGLALLGAADATVTRYRAWRAWRASRANTALTPVQRHAALRASSPGSVPPPFGR